MISVVMSYYNRKHQLRYTLETLRQSTVQDYEIIIVEDFCDEDQQLPGIEQEFSDLPIKLIRMQDIKSSKDYCNPCVPYNVGLRAAVGEHILIQNPECAHQGDVLAHVSANLKDDVYLSYHCYSATKAETEILQSGDPMPMFTHKKSRWYNHRQERPAAFHFASALTRRLLCRLNGFDERYAQGHNMDDLDLVERVKLSGAEIRFVADPWVVHQYHSKSYNNPHSPPVTVDNRALWEMIKQNLQVRAQAVDICSGETS